MDSEARRLTALVEPREIELSKDAEKYEARLAAIKKEEEDRIAAERAEAERLAREALQARVKSVVALGGVPDLGFLGAATESDFSDLLASLQAAKDERDAIAARESAEAAERARIAEEERIARERAEAIERAKREAEEAAERAEKEAQRLTDYSSTVDRALARFCGAFGDGPDAPYPGMIAAFETHYGQSFRDKEWRTEAACWAAAWSKAAARAESSLSAPQSDALEQVRAEEHEACAKACDELFPPPGEQMAVEWAAGTIACANAIRARGHK